MCRWLRVKRPIGGFVGFEVSRIPRFGRLGGSGATVCNAIRDPSTQMHVVKNKQTSLEPAAPVGDGLQRGRCRRDWT